MQKQRIETIESNDMAEFTSQVNTYLEEGWTISSTSCGFANSEAYEFCSIYQAVLVMEMD